MINNFSSFSELYKKFKSFGGSVIDVGGGEKHENCDATIDFNLSVGSTYIHDINIKPWPIADKKFDFSVCAHTLEDIRDPIGAVNELKRISKAGVIECPSRLDEVPSDTAHHHWLVQIEANGLLRFSHKNYSAYLPEIRQKYNDLKNRINFSPINIRFYWIDGQIDLNAYEHLWYFDRYDGCSKKACVIDHGNYLDSMSKKLVLSNVSEDGFFNAVKRIWKK